MRRPSRVVISGVTVLGAAGVLAGCAAASAPDTGSPADVVDYTDGTYAATGSYQTPETVEQIDVVVTIEDSVITAVEVTGSPVRRESQDYQGRFIGGISDEVVGKRIDEISVSRVAGSSLTSGGFNQAIEQIKTEAAG